MRSGIFWIGLATAFARLADALALIVVAANLSATEFGIATAIKAVQAIMESVAGTGLGTSVAIVQAPNLTRAGARSVFWYTAAIGLLGAGLLVGLAQPVAWWNNLQFSEVSPLLMIAAPRFIFLGAAVTPLCLMYRETQFKNIAIIDAIGAASGALTRGGLALAGFGSAAVVAAGTVQAGALMIACFAISRFSPTLSIAWAEVKALARYGFSVTGAMVGAVLQRNIDYLVVGRLLDSDTLGVYGVAFQVSNEPLQPIGDLGVRTGGPTLARLTDQKERFAAAFNDLVRPIAILSTLVAVGIFVVADEVMVVIKDGEYVTGIACARLLLVASLGRIFFQLYQPLFEWSGAGKTGSALNLLAVVSLAVALVVSITFGFDALGLTAIGLGWVAALPIPIYVGWRLQKRLHGMKLKPVLKALAPALVSGGAALVVGMLLGEVTAGRPESDILRWVAQLGGVILTYGVVLQLGFGLKLMNIKPPKAAPAEEVDESTDETDAGSAPSEDI